MNRTFEAVKQHNNQLAKAYENIKRESIHKICVIGMGYIGLPTAAILANRGFEVVGVDVDQKVIDTINRGKLHIVEPDLDVFVQGAVSAGKLKVFDHPQAANVFFICVPTPFVTDENNEPQPDLSFVKQAVKNIADFVQPGNAIILESTSPVGSTEMMHRILQENGVDVEKTHIAYCPERVLPGHIIMELIENDRIVGGINPSSTRFVANFYRSFVAGEVLETDCRTAEMCKLTENSSRDVQIAFANELSMICDDLEIDVWELIKLANRHPRVNILNPGVGVGGHCIAVDPWFIIARNPGQAKLIRSARQINDYKTLWVIEKAKNRIMHLQNNGKEHPVVGVLGLAFKPNIDDLRESPALKVAKALQREGCDLIVCEPNIQTHQDFKLVSLEDILSQSDIILALVSHKQFAGLNDARIIDLTGLHNA